MIEFMRDKEGNLYSVKDGVVIGRILSTGDEEVEDNGTGSEHQSRKPY